MFLSGVADFFVDAGEAVVEQVSSLAAGIEHTFEDAIDTTGDALNTVYEDGKGIVVWAGDRFEQAEDLAVSTVNSGTRLAENVVNEVGILGEKAIDDSTSLISTPATLLFGGLGLALVFAGRNTSASVSYAR